MNRYSAILLYFFGFLALCGCKDSSEEYSHTRENELAALSVDFRTTYDARDGKAYRIVSVGDRDWMAENLDFQTENSWCYRDSVKYCNMYGRLYSWEDAMKACPEGWKLPADEDWKNLQKIAAVDSSELKDYYARHEGKKIAGMEHVVRGYRGPLDGIRLKTKKGWKSSYYDEFKGRDELGFSTLPAGMRNIDGTYKDLKGFAYFWSASEMDSSSANVWHLGYNLNRFTKAFTDGFGGHKEYGFSVRCVRRSDP